MTRRKAVVFGLDGACWEMIEPWVTEGDLPTLRGLIDRGCRSALRSCVPATTPPAWTSLTTGVNPGKHGVYGFHARERGSYAVSPVSDADVHARRLWDYTSRADLRSIVVNVPVTHPPRPLEGVLVPGYLSPDRPETYPATILEDVDAEDYQVYAPSEGEGGSDGRLLEEWLALTRSRAELARALMGRLDWDLLFLEFQKTDGAVHKFDDRSKVRRIYEQVDDCMADVLDAVDGPANVFVVSDHGIGQPKEWAVALNTWLVEKEFARTTRERRRGGSKDWLEWATAERGDTVSDERTRWSRRALSRVTPTRQAVERALAALGLYDVARRAVPDALKSAIDEGVVDRANSTAFYEGFGFSGVDTGLIVNDERFYDEGIVSEAEYDEVRDRLVRELERLDGPEGSAFTRVRTREEVYHGDRTPYAPDIVLEQAPEYVIGSERPRGKTFIRTKDGRVDHTRNGIIVAAGPDIVPDWTLKGVPSIFDVTPTLLHLLGCPLNERFDGSVLDGLLAVDRDPRRRRFEPYEPGHGYTYSEAERESLRRRLEGMGYLE